MRHAAAAAGEPADALERAIRHCSDELARSRYGPDALSVMISQIGNDLKAREWLAKLDGNPAIGQLVDVTSNYEVESQELLQTTGIECVYACPPPLPSLAHRRLLAPC